MPSADSTHRADICLLDIEKRLLPHAQSMKRHLERGMPPDDTDIEFLLQFQKAIQNLSTAALNHPEHHVALGSLIQLYSSLVSMATENAPDAYPDQTK